jgi:peptide/nickel transport system substrate-binding protein
MSMNRRSFLTGAAGCVSAAIAPQARAGAALPHKTRILRFVPQGNLSHPDPLVSLSPAARNSGHMIWDQLFGLTLSGEVKPQMVGSHEVSPDGHTWRFTLRDGLRFHDGAPVRATDCVASLHRWGKRRSIGQKILAESDRIAALDDQRFEIVTRRPFPNMVAMLGLDTFFFIMPEPIANTPPLEPIKSFVGSGPYRFVADEWQSGVRAVYARNEQYVPRSEPADFLAGGKRVWFDLVEWMILPDPATAAAALQRGEVDWVQRPLPDLIPVLRDAPGVRVLPPDPVGFMLLMVFNHLQPPFNNVELRRALLPAIDQSQFVQAAIGDDPTIGHPGVGFFTPGQGMDSAVGMEALTKPRDLALARKLVAESGYARERIVILQPADVPEQRAICEVAHELFRSLGLNSELVMQDVAAIEKRRLSREPVDKGGWSVLAITFDGLGASDPANHQALRGNGVAGFFGWPTSPEMERLRDQWFVAPDVAGQRHIAEEMQRTAFAQVPFMPLGHWLPPMAIRTSMADVTSAPFPVFWNARRA